jgi:hypothetical protein
LDYRSLGQNIPGAGGIYGRSAAAMRHGQQMLSDDQSPGTSDIQNESNQYFQKVNMHLF